MDQALGARYVLRERLGRGGMGTVYRASRRDGGTDRAVKVLHPNLVDDPAILARFVQERSIMTELRSPHLVEVEDLIVDGDSVGIVMELVAGGSLRSYIERYAPLPPALALTIVGQVLAGLVPVHGAGIVHRDLKPENVLLTGGHPGAPTVKVSDFGIARLTSSPALTRGSDVIGTPHYIAPELADRAPATPSVDIYAAGVLLHELLTGATPYAGDTLWSALRKQAEAPPPPPPGVPDAVAALLTMWLDPRPHYRPANAAEAIGQSEPIRVLLFGQGGRTPAPPAAGPVGPGVRGPAISLPDGQTGIEPAAATGPPLPSGFVPEQRSDSQGWTRPPGSSWPAASPPAGTPQNQSGSWTRAPGNGPITGGWGGTDSQSTPMYGTTSTRVPAQRSAFETGIAPRIPLAPPHARRRSHQLWVLVGLAAVLLAIVGTGAFIALSSTGSKDPRLAFGVEHYPQTGVEVTRNWELVGKRADSVKGTLTVLLGKGGPVDVDEVLPRIMVGASPTITPTPNADTVKPGPDPVFRYHVQGTPGQKVVVSYVVAVPAGPRTVGRLQAWVSARNAAAAAYWQEKHQLSQLSTDPTHLQINLPSPPQQLKLSGKQSDGTDAPTVALSSASWKSEDPTVATVDQQGDVRGVGAGSTKIIATIGKAVASADVTVTAPAIPLPAAGCQPLSGDAPTAAVHDTTVTVTWRPVKIAHCTLTGYIITASPSAQTQTLSAGSNSVDFTALEPGSYTFTVIAQFGSDGQGNPSPASDPVDVSCGSVGAPSDIRARLDPSADGSVNVTWTDPTVPSGCPSPSSYVVELDGNDVSPYSSTDYSATLTSVDPGSHGVNVVGVLDNGQRIPGAGTSVDVPAPQVSSSSPDNSDSSSGSGGGDPGSTPSPSSSTGD